MALAHEISTVSTDAGHKNTGSVYSAFSKGSMAAKWRDMNASNGFLRISGMPREMAAAARGLQLRAANVGDGR